MKERYRHVYERGRVAGFNEAERLATNGLLRLLRAGWTVTASPSLDPLADGLYVRNPERTKVAFVSSATILGVVPDHRP